MQILPVILAGGAGTRLWPLSRRQHPKQFLALTGDATLLQTTVQRLAGLQTTPPLLICNEEHRFLAAEQLRSINHEDASILLEPAGRNTAPAIALAALHATRNGDDAILLVLAADHFIPDTRAFHQCIKNSLPLAHQDKLVACGVIPTHAETGYGYIEQGTPIKNGFSIKRFIEKPDQATAQAYLDTGSFLWNSGMFVFKASRYLQELGKFAPQILKSCQSAMQSPEEDLTFIRADKDAFEACPSDSIDYAVMEKTDNAVVVPLDAGWSDIGSWPALWDISVKDEATNATHGDVVVHDSINNYVYADNRLVTTVGVSNLVIVETKDAVLVAHKDHVQDIKNIVAQLQIDGRSECLAHREIYRPWGKYDSIDQGDRYQVKRITVKPGAKLSMQKHHHRAEHWIIVRGTARITNGDEVYMLTENQSTYIPVGQIHSLENPGCIDLELIEVQSGSYLGEDDIVRLEDRYGRTDKI